MVRTSGCFEYDESVWPNHSLNPDASLAALVRRPLGAGFVRRQESSLSPAWVN